MADDLLSFISLKKMFKINYGWVVRMHAIAARTQPKVKGAKLVQGGDGTGEPGDGKETGSPVKKISC